MKPITPQEQAAVRWLASNWLGLYARQLGELHDDLKATRQTWQVGFSEVDDYYWCAPMTADQRTLAFPFNVIKFEWWHVEEAMIKNPYKDPNRTAIINADWFGESKRG